MKSKTSHTAMFYLKNYKAIHHLATMAILGGALFLFGFDDVLKSFPMLMLLLVVNYYITKTTLAASGLDRAIESYLENINSDDKD